MAARYSRYIQPPVALAADAHGRTPATTPLRAHPDITGMFGHVVAEWERLDQLAFRYYEEPTLWWRICDANPEFLSPLALLGQEPVISCRFPLRDADNGPAPDWSAVTSVLAAIVGVENVGFDENVEYVTVTLQLKVIPTLGPLQVPVVKSRFRRSLVVTFNRTATSADAVGAVIKSCGLDVDAPVETGQVGREIIIPPLGAV